MVEDGGDGEDDNGHNHNGEIVFDKGNVAEEVAGSSE